MHNYQWQNIKDAVLMHSHSNNSVQQQTMCYYVYTFSHLRATTEGTL